MRGLLVQKIEVSGPGDFAAMSLMYPSVRLSKSATGKAAHMVW